MLLFSGFRCHSVYPRMTGLRSSEPSGSPDLPSAPVMRKPKDVSADEETETVVVSKW